MRHKINKMFLPIQVLFLQNQNQKNLGKRQ